MDYWYHPHLFIQDARFRQFLTRGKANVITIPPASTSSASWLQLTPPARPAAAAELAAMRLLRLLPAAREHRADERGVGKECIESWAVRGVGGHGRTYRRVAAGQCPAAASATAAADCSGAL